MKQHKRFLTGLICFVLTISVILLNLGNGTYNAATSKLLKVHFINVGQADSILVQTPNGKNMLVDAGNNDDGNLVVSYLKQQGVKKLDVVVATHPHEDHIGGMDNVIESFSVGSVYMPKVTANTATFRDVASAMNSKRLKANTPVSGKYISLDNNVKIQILAPNGSSYEDLNNYSIVLRLTYGKNSFLLTGDAEDVSENQMLAKHYNLKADLLKVGHHGSSSSTTSAFLKAVNPKYAVISVGKGNTYGHPTPATLLRLAAQKVQIFRTDQAGTIIATSDGNTIKINKKASPVKVNAPPKSSSSTTKVVPKPSNSKNVTVYITKTGKKYHLAGCRSLSRSKISIKLSDAKARGYAPCSICHPPQ